MKDKDLENSSVSVNGRKTTQYVGGVKDSVYDIMANIWSPMLKTWNMKIYIYNTVHLFVACISEIILNKYIF